MILDRSAICFHKFYLKKTFINKIRNAKQTNIGQAMIIFKFLPTDKTSLLISVYSTGDSNMQSIFLKEVKRVLYR